MENNKFAKLKSIIELMQNDTVTPDVLRGFLQNVLNTIKENKEGFEDISKQTIAEVSKALEYIQAEHETFMQNVKDEAGNVYKKSDELEKRIKEVKKLCSEMKDCMPKDGENGKDADEEYVIESVLAKIPKPKEVILDNAEKIRDKLETLEGESRLDASAIKNLPEFIKDDKRIGFGSMLKEAPKDGLIYGRQNRTWVEVTSVSTSPLTTKGDIYTYSTTDTRLPVGANGYILSADSTEVTGLKWIPNSSSNAWSILGNTGTTAGTNFVGTTDNQDLVFKRNNIELLRIGTDSTTISRTVVDPTTDLVGWSQIYTVDNTADSSNGIVITGSRSLVQVNDNYTHDGDLFIGGFLASSYNGTNSITGLAGGYGEVKNESTGTVGLMTGLATNGFNNSTGTVGDMIGLLVDMSNTGGGTVTTGTGVLISTLVGTNKIGFSADIDGSYNVFREMQLKSQSQLKFYDSDSSNYVSFKSPATVASNTEYILPSTYPSVSGQALVSTTAGVMSWASVGSGTVNSGTQYQMAFYNATGTAVSGNSGIVTDALNMLAITSSAGTGTLNAEFQLNSAAHTALTASTEYSSFVLNGAVTQQFATGALTKQRYARIAAPTYSFVGASTIQLAATLAISGAPIRGTNATINNSIGLWIQSNAVGTVVEAAGAFIEAPTGGTSNYSLVLGGSGTTSSLRVNSTAGNAIEIQNGNGVEINMTGTGNSQIRSSATGEFDIYTSSVPMYFSTNNLSAIAMNITSNKLFVGANTAATAKLHIAAGSATANTAPLKFTSGTLNTTAEAGAMEFLSEKFYLTPTSTARASVPGVLFTQTSSATVANTVTETTIIGSGVGSVTLPANFFVAGKTIRLRGYGFHSTTGSPTVRLRIKLGSTTILDTTAINSHVATDAQVDWEGIITCRTTGATGTVIGQGFYQEFQNPDVSIGMVNTTTTTIDTTSSLAVNATIEWGTADVGNTITVTNLILEVLN